MSDLTPQAPRNSGTALARTKPGSGAMLRPRFFYEMHDARAKSTFFAERLYSAPRKNFMEERFTAKLSIARSKITLIIFRF